MDILINLFKADPIDKELEVRLYIDPRTERSYNIGNPLLNKETTVTFTKIITELLSTSGNIFNITRSIDFIQSGSKADKITKRYQLIFPGKIENYQSKRSIKSVYEHTPYGNYKVSLTEEKDIPEDSRIIENYSLIRVKFRISIIIPEFNDYRYDITFVKNHDNHQYLVASKTKLLLVDTNITNKNFFRYAPFDACDYIECEVEYIGKDYDISIQSIGDAVNKIYRLIDPGKEFVVEYQTYLRLISKFINKNQRYVQNTQNIILKRLYNAVKELGRLTYFENVWPTISNWWLTDKADGKRCIVVVTSNKLVIVSDRLYFIAVKGGKNMDDKNMDDKNMDDKNMDDKNMDDKNMDDKNMDDDVTIVDAELVYESKNIHITPEKKPILFTFDVIAFEGNNLAQQTFGKRITYLDKATSIINKHPSLRGKKIAVTKPYVKLTKDNYGKEIKKLFNRSDRYYTIDGLIFTPDSPNEIEIRSNQKNKYQINTTYKNMSVWKWKPPSHMSIDFLIKRPEKLKIADKSGYVLYYLFCGIRSEVFQKAGIIPVEEFSQIFGDKVLNNDYHPIQFPPSSNPLAYQYWHPIKQKVTGLDDKHKKFPLDSNIGEFRLNHDKKTGEDNWELMRIRTDRINDAKSGNDFGNDFNIAEIIWDNFHNPLLLADLITPPDNKMYFQVESDIHKPQRAFNSYIKSQLFSKFKDTNWVIDIGSGKGQDLFRYSENNIKKILFTDNDSEALSELLRRKQILLGRKQASNPMNIYTKNIDFTKNWKSNLTAIKTNMPIPDKGVDLIVCSLAFHYLMANSKQLVNIIKFIKMALVKGGQVFISTFNGQDVYDLLKKHKGVYKVYDKSKTIVKYAITANYKGEFSQIGQAIEVILPFSAGQKYTESLVNVDYVLKTFTKYGFTIIEQKSYGAYLDDFKKYNAVVYNQLDDDDKEYVSLYQYFILKKS